MTDAQASADASVAREVIEAFGGLSSTARALGHKHASTVHGWLRTGRIPGWRRHEIEAAAKAKGVDLPANFAQPATAA